MKGQSGSGTHDVGLILAMYNRPTAGAEHVNFSSQKASFTELLALNASHVPLDTVSRREGETVGDKCVFIHV